MDGDPGPGFMNRIRRAFFGVPAATPDSGPQNRKNDPPGRPSQVPRMQPHHQEVLQMTYHPQANSSIDNRVRNDPQHNNINENLIFRENIRPPNRLNNLQNENMRRNDRNANYPNNIRREERNVGRDNRNGRVNRQENRNNAYRNDNIRGHGRREGNGGHNNRDQNTYQNEQIGDDGNGRRNNRGGNQQHYPNMRFLGFLALKEISEADNNDVIERINNRKEGFLNTLNSNIDNPDMFAIILKLIANICQSSFDQIKLNLLLEICNSGFIASLKTYLIDLPFIKAKSKARNNWYWKNQLEFWENFVTFSESIMNLSPSTAVQKCKSILATSKFCLEELNRNNDFQMSSELGTKLTQLRERLDACEKEEQTDARKVTRMNLTEHDAEPPEDFRQLSVIPSHEDLIDVRPFVRANVVHGRYRDTEHYLDVQFRLLREDCFGPLRTGILQLLDDPNQVKKKFDNIRVIRNVKFIEPYISNNKIGKTVQFDEKTFKSMKRINWAHSKRFIFGSLMLFTKDKCKTFITATILDRDVQMLAKGKIAVSIVGSDGNMNLYNDTTYMMIESEVYFEPYYHALKALQDPKFPEHIAMAKYIVQVEPHTNPPIYLNHDTTFSIETFKFKPLDQLTWPNRQDLGLNESQYEAYKMALTHEFAVIQGPPGTGKTFLGVKLAKTLLNNVKVSNGCHLLVICYTNHALDQFLEAIMSVTNSMARFGGQSRNEVMEKFNINKLRLKEKHYKRNTESNRLFLEHRHNLKLAVSDLKSAQERVEELENGVINYNSIKEYAPESRILDRYNIQMGNGDNRSDPLKFWLFENMYNVNFNETFAGENAVQANEDVNYVDEHLNERMALIFDDFNDDDDGGNTNASFLTDSIKTSFSVHESEKMLKNLLTLYSKTNNLHHRDMLEKEIVDIRFRIHLFKLMSANRNQRVRPRIPRCELARIPVIDRWRLYFKWADVILNDLKSRLKPLQEEFVSANTAYEEARMILDLKLLQGIKVVGMTTSGAARLRKLLVALAPPIVIVEEAAEVLEQHIVTALTKSCQHLILIGDHQQLRPSAAYMKLARDYNIEVSLFERMITNGMHSRRLCVQHRMRPEIAALISPHIYPDLVNHPSVEMFPKVRGMADNMFFFSHDFQEEEVDDSSSRMNHKEADMTLGLANYLMQQGYKPSEVTILAAYSGQMFYMRKQRENYAYLSQVKITVVDNYQGEESKIILLSLVRNNKNNKIGFLATENRVCVALSRAKEGFYIFGNIDILKNNTELWNKIADTLEKKMLLGTNLILKCENHPDQITVISTAIEFNKVPEGGCLLKCNFNLPACGHPCPSVCHGYDRSHVLIKCPKNCERIICDLGHVCPLVCSVKCKPCKIMVEKTLPCGHKMLVYCYKEPNDTSIKCLTMVPVTLGCGHDTLKPCHQKIESVKCVVPCEFRVDRCGHQCRLKCHVNDDPDHDRYCCEKPCAKMKKGCCLDENVVDRTDHQCPKRCHEDCDLCTVEVTKKRSACKHSQRVACHEDVDAKPCLKNCARALVCGHFCKKKCHEPCGDCKQRITKPIPGCGHLIATLCMQEPKQEMCICKCERTLPCGHPCTDLCRRSCDPTKCTKLTSKEYEAPCGHRVRLPCNINYSISIGSVALNSTLVLEHCSAPCHVELACDHVCEGTCARCHQGRLHVACSQTCHQDNICGHQCKEPCNKVCPPCRMPCEIKCPHSRCKKLCGEPCTPCQEKCSRRCVHGSCLNRCGDPCTVKPCSEPCALALRCGHACRGLCGEPCPDVCKECRPDDFPRVLGYDEFFDDDVKFVQFQDCTHVMAVDDMDNLMMGDSATIEIRQCPFCRKKIFNMLRYKDIINVMINTNINPIKEKTFGNERIIKAKKGELIVHLINFPENNTEILDENIHWRSAFDQLRKTVKTQKKVTLLQIEMQFQFLEILEMVSEYYQKFKAVDSAELRTEFSDVIKMICCVLNANAQKLSQQQQEDIGNEMKRLNSIIQLSKLLRTPAYISSKALPQIMNAFDAAKKSVLSWHKYRDEESMTALNELQAAVNVSGVVTKQERDLIVKAIGLKAGHWYKCPNGHFYCIGECGGAVMESTCPECGARIGGESHRLRADNAHAPEMEGSRYPAWSQQNNMGNFLI